MVNYPLPGKIVIPPRTTDKIHYGAGVLLSQGSEMTAKLVIFHFSGHFRRVKFERAHLVLKKTVGVGGRLIAPFELLHRRESELGARRGVQRKRRPRFYVREAEAFVDLKVG